MSDNTYWLIKSGYPDHWPEWEDQDVISVGWEVGDHVDESWNDLRARVMEEFDTDDLNWAGNATGAIKTLAGTHRRKKQQMAPGDIAIIIGTDHVHGSSVVRAVAELGEYQFKEEGLTGTGIHQYLREIENWLYNDGPIPKTELDDRFRQGGSDSLHLASTVKRSKFHERDTLDTLLSQLEETDPIEEPEYGFELNQERTLELYLEENIDRLNEDDIETVTRQVQLTKENRIDLVCIRDGGQSPLLIELKKGLGEMSHLKQLSRYLDVYEGDSEGLLVAQQFKEGVLDTAAERDDIRLKEFEIDLVFEPPRKLSSR
ncbi:endonuclease NucS domain-containing protein [Haloglomus halophilum]|uniref:endonuclease NucS domain-containing protein n=1 Tax=Haloglomus halophilum TaxID=2962672 RepID=UPI0020CA2372|nr:endonuclease NucS domain-containing protein [Haloglomus halophilum]